MHACTTAYSIYVIIYDIACQCRWYNKYTRIYIYIYRIDIDTTDAWCAVFFRILSSSSVLSFIRCWIMLLLVPFLPSRSCCCCCRCRCIRTPTIAVHTKPDRIKTSWSKIPEGKIVNKHFAVNTRGMDLACWARGTDVKVGDFVYKYKYIYVWDQKSQGKDSAKGGLYLLVWGAMCRRTFVVVVVVVCRFRLENNGTSYTHI